LINDWIIFNLDKENVLSCRANEVFTTFKNNNLRKKPGHGPILKNILIKDKNSIAIETPIWIEVNNTYLTGHIDLIQLKKGIIYIIDYKPEGNFIYSLPQVATYGLVFKKIFNIKKLNCISFNKDHAWEYKPEILLNEIRDYLISQKIDTRIWENFFEF
ncbi:MAG: hypothetical protein P8Y97_15640, partial [Candidatus Lokiarchaeota archaeon]